MSKSDLDHLRAHAAEHGIDTEALTLTTSDGRYRLDVAGETYENLSEVELGEVLSEHPAVVREWAFWHRHAPQHPARWAVLRWLEDADAYASPSDRRAALKEGAQQPWGQLLLSVRLNDNDRRIYELRHVDDVDQAADTLDAHDDPLDARHLATYDTDGRYRPLATAPTLQTGWVFPSLDAAALVQAVDFFYPATIANWHRERTGELDVTHWAEATERQTGIYAITEELDGEAVDWVAEACCVDSQCLKRRQWDEREDRPLSVPRGDGAFPCREPCSLVIAAARTWVRLEREEEQTYTVQLTPSEKEQLDTILDAVADGTTGEVREADVGNGANRYRARYLRAKRAGDTLYEPQSEGEE
jgi:hypothetical protein